MKQLRILHVVGPLKVGGIENWLIHVLRHIDRERFQIDILTRDLGSGDYEDTARAFGATLYDIGHPRDNLLVYRRDFRQIIKTHGPFDIIHSHSYHFSGFILRMAYHCWIPVRIAHNHTTSQVATGNIGRSLYANLMQAWLRKYATHRLAVSEAAASFNREWQYFPTSVDLAPFSQSVDKQAIRAMLGLPPDAVVIGHVGRFVPAKNHEFLVDLAPRLMEQIPTVHFLLIGDGETRAATEAQVTAKGLTERFHFTGTRDDVARLMLGAMDVFVFPSRYEGLGLVIIEALAAGLPCVMTDVVPPETHVIPEAIWRLPLDAEMSQWVEAIRQAAAARQSFSPADFQAKIRATPFDIQQNVRNLESLYNNGVRSLKDD